MKNVVMNVIALCFYSCAISAEPDSISPYFSYTSSDIRQLQSLSSNHTMSKEELQRLDEMTAIALKNSKSESFGELKLWTYLYVAQSDAAYLASKSTGSFKGTLVPLTQKMLELFLKTPIQNQNISSDPFSEALATIVFKKVQQRVNEENARTDKFEVPENQKEMFSVGLNFAKWIPWFAKPSTAFWPPPPPDLKSPIWKEQILQIKQAQTPMTEEKKRIIYLWAGMTDPAAIDWRLMANKYLFTHESSLSKAFKVRSVLMIALYDGFIACFTSKYHYLAIRPKIYDPSVDYMIEVPKHPSYPAGHSLEGAIASTILSSYFPANSASWNQMADEEGISRIWAGIHYPLDNQAANESGTKVANYILKATSGR